MEVGGQRLVVRTGLEDQLGESLDGVRRACVEGLEVGGDVGQHVSELLWERARVDGLGRRERFGGRIFLVGFLRRLIQR